MTIAAKRDKVAAEIRKLEAELREAEAKAAEELRQLSAAVALHEISETVGAKRRASIVAAVEKLRGRITTLTEALPELDRRTLAEEQAARMRTGISASVAASTYGSKGVWTRPDSSWLHIVVGFAVMRADAAIRR